MPVYRVSVDGCGIQGSERFGTVIGSVPVDMCPDMVVHLGRAVASSGMSFDEWYSERRIVEVLGDYLI